MSLSEARYHDLIDAVHVEIEDVFDDSGLDVDLENSAGVLTVRFENGSHLIFSRQEPARPTAGAAAPASAGSVIPAMSHWVNC